jgi:hypothetical protein
VTEELKALLSRILETQQGCQKALLSTQAQVDALIYALIGIDSRVAALYSEQLQIEQQKQAALLEKCLKDISLLRATVSSIQ